MTDLAGKIALITGSTSGIGKTALRLRDEQEDAEHPARRRPERDGEERGTFVAPCGGRPPVRSSEFVTSGTVTRVGR
jgi:NAD(P)-dependent dehydrogenase (short-subunit alcohol dehydrogenase family)